MRNIGRSMTGAKALGKKTYIGPLMSADFACHKTIDMKGPVTEVLSLAGAYCADGVSASPSSVKGEALGTHCTDQPAGVGCF